MELKDKYKILIIVIGLIISIIVSHICQNYEHKKFIKYELPRRIEECNMCRKNILPVYFKGRVVKEYVPKNGNRGARTIKIKLDSINMREILINNICNFYYYRFEEQYLMIDISMHNYNIEPYKIEQGDVLEKKANTMIITIYNKYSFEFMDEEY